MKIKSVILLFFIFISFCYAKEKKPVKKITLDMDGNTIEIEKYEYNQNNQKTKIINEKDNSVEITEIKYDKWNNISEIIKNGKLKFKYIYEYNSKGQVLKEHFETPEGEIFGQTEYEYDKAGNREKEYHYLENEVYSSAICVYDKKHKLEKKYVYDNKGKETLNEYKFDKKGNFIEFYNDGILIAKHEYIYDKKGNIAEDFYTDNIQGIKTHLLYEY